MVNIAGKDLYKTIAGLWDQKLKFEKHDLSA